MQPTTQAGYPANVSSPNRLGFVFGVPALPAHTNDKYKDFYGGYHDGAVAADNDYSSGKGVGFHGCPAAGHSQEYCKGYEAGYNDEGVFYL